jgi:hypothetical protein
MSGELIIERHYLPRLFKRSPFVRYKNPVHETLDWEYMERTRHILVNGNHVYKSKTGYIAHLGYDRPIQELIAKAYRNIALITSNTDKGYDDCNLYYHLIRTYTFLKEYDKMYAAALKLRELLDKNGQAQKRKVMSLECDAVISMYLNKLY